MQEDGKLSTTSSFKSSFRQSEDFIDTTITVPPDGGWGWIVVLGSFLCNFVADGAIYTFGIFLDDISRTYHTKPTVVAIGNSLMTGFYYFSGTLIVLFSVCFNLKLQDQLRVLSSTAWDFK
jgi:hypothetical protein